MHKKNILLKNSQSKVNGSRGPQLDDHNSGRHSNQKRFGRIHSSEFKDENINTH